MSVNLTFRPMVAWPGTETPSWKRQRSQFNTPWRKSVELMVRELDMLDAREPIVIEIALRDDDFTRDWQVRASARVPSMPGVIVSFRKPMGDAQAWVPLSFPCDRFTIWEDNFRAVVLRVFPIASTRDLIKLAPYDDVDPPQPHTWRWPPRV